uniref:Uncharacterized protein n=1 Tax=Nelumbo nucifera TaxID=4432 RepID=A0A822YXB2_NELNU|nr:TPA_asm: hypothetical protein HUJ06_007454 [Nelumbo nucifera]
MFWKGEEFGRNLSKGEAKVVIIFKRLG